MAVLLLALGLSAALAFRKDASSLSGPAGSTWPGFGGPVARRLSTSSEQTPILAEHDDESADSSAPPASTNPGGVATEPVRRASGARNRRALQVPTLAPTSPAFGARSSADSPSRYERDVSPIGTLFGPVPAEESSVALAAIDRDRWHTLEDGDTLAELAVRYLGDAGRWQEIYDANRDVLLEPDVLPLGRRLRIPPREGRPASSPAKEAPVEESFSEEEEPGPLVPIPD